MNPSRGIILFPERWNIVREDSTLSTFPVHVAQNDSCHFTVFTSAVLVGPIDRQRFEFSSCHGAVSLTILQTQCSLHFINAGCPVRLTPLYRLFP